MMSADEALGYVYLPFGTPANDYYGGQRPGNGLFGESLVCLDARTGKRVWHFQMVHHGLWDYDLPAAPNLIDIRVNGKPVKAVAQVSKQGFVYVFDRVTGKPIWPIEERPVPQSTVPGERSSPTQPFPTKPAPFDRQGVTQDDVIDFTPELRKQALAVLEKYNYGPLFTPPSLEKPTIVMPGIAGGASWAGAAFDPETGIALRLVDHAPVRGHAVEVAGARRRLRRESGSGGDDAGHPALETALRAHHRHRPEHGRPPVDGAAGRPGAKQSRVASSSASLPLGRPARGHVLLTKTLLIVGQEGTTQRERRQRESGAGIRDRWRTSRSTTRNSSPTTRRPARLLAKWRCRATRRARR